jgi:hypothetical protein
MERDIDKVLKMQTDIWFGDRKYHKFSDNAKMCHFYVISNRWFHHLHPNDKELKYCK